MRTFAQKSKPAQQTKSTDPIMHSRRSIAQNQAVHSILHLQRTIGNQVVQWLPKADAESLAVVSDTTATARFGHDFSRIPVHASTRGSIQPKMKMNAPRDQYKEEADRVADQVMRMPEPQLQYDCTCGGEYPRCQKEHGSHRSLQTERTQAGATRGTAGPSSVHEVLRSPGQSMDLAARGFFAPRFGHDFSQVRVHTGAKAVESAGALSAPAYTAGHHTVFGAGQHAPHTTKGGKLVQRQAKNEDQSTFCKDCPPTCQTIAAEYLTAQLKPKKYLSWYPGVHICLSESGSPEWICELSLSVMVDDEKEAKPYTVKVKLKENRAEAFSPSVPEWPLCYYKIECKEGVVSKKESEGCVVI